MAVTINGTTGITTPALENDGITTVAPGSAAAPAITTDGDTNTGIFFPAADTIAFSEGGAEAMRIDSSGNVGIGTTDTQLFNAVGGSTRLAVCGSSASTDILGNTGASISIINTDQTANNTAGLHFARADTDDAPNYAGASIVAQFPDAQVTGQYPKGLLAFLTSTTANTAPTEKMRIDSSGNLLVGTTSATSPNPGFGFAVGSNAQLTIGHDTGSASGQYYIPFKYNTNLIGGITQNGTTAVAYNTTSDYRLKENIAPLTGALARIAALKPVTYTWKAAPDEAGEGFIAHELAEVCPSAVSGEKDAVDADGNPQYQGIDTSFLVATLTAAIQELKAEVDALKGAQA